MLTAFHEVLNQALNIVNDNLISNNNKTQN